MQLVDRIAARFGFERRSADPSWGALAAMTGTGAAVNARAAENIATVQACVSVIASTVSVLPVYVYRRQGADRVEVVDHPLARFVRQGPNDWQTWPDLIEAWTAAALMHGNGLLAVEGGQLRFVPWPWVTVSILPSGRLAYDVSEAIGPLGAAGRRYRLLQDEVAHLRDRSDDGVIGRSRLSRGAETVAAAQTANAFTASFFANGAAPAGAITSETSMTPQQRAELREGFDERHKGTANAGKVLILSGGLKFEPFQVSPEDAELLDARRFSVEEICRLFQVPPPLVQDLSHGTFTNSREAARWFSQFTLTPWVRKIEATLSRALFAPESGLEIEFDMSGLLRADPESRWASHKIAVDAKILDPDEVREIEGFNPRGKAVVA